MNEPGDSAGEQPIGAFDAASYIFQISSEMALLAATHRFNKLAAALELSRDLAAESLALVAASDHAGSRNAAAADDT